MTVETQVEVRTMENAVEPTRASRLNLVSIRFCGAWLFAVSPLLLELVLFGLLPAPPDDRPYTRMSRLLLLLPLASTALFGISLLVERSLRCWQNLTFAGWLLSLTFLNFLGYALIWSLHDMQQSM